MIALLNPGGRRKRRYRSSGRKRRKVSARARRKLSLAARRRALKAAFKKGMAKCGQLVARAHRRRKHSAAAPASSGGLYRSVGLNPRRRKYRYRRNMWAPSYGYNPSGVVSSVTKPFSMGTLMGALPIVGGALATGMVSGLIDRTGILPASFNSGIAKSGIQLAAAGIAGALVNMIAPQYAKGATLGGAVVAVNTAAKSFGLQTGLSGMGCDPYGMAGMGDWLRSTQPEVSAPVSRPQLGGLGLGNSPSEFCDGNPFGGEEGGESF